MNIKEAIKKNIKEIIKETKQDIKNILCPGQYNITEYKNRFEKKEYILTPTELKFYKTLKEVTNELNLIICPQVSLYEIVKANKYNDFNRISNKTIDFVITETNLRIKCCIELDDYTHNRQDRIQRDNFINQLFKDTNIKLIRIEVKSQYNKDEIKKAIMTL